MNIFFALFLGVVQGLTEFLPVSSSGHLAIFQNFFGVRNVETDYLLFDVLLHLATLAAVCFFYRVEIGEIFRDLWRALFQRNKAQEGVLEGGVKGGKLTPPLRLLIMIIVSILPLFVFVLFSHIVEAAEKSTLVVGIFLIVTAVLLFLSGRVPKGAKTERDAKWTDALIVGVAQGFATLPGLSRSGTTITAGMFVGFERQFAVKFSFLMSIPAILGANILEIKGAAATGFNTAELPAYILGMLAAGVIGYFSLGLLKRIASKGGFTGFAWYCLAVGAVVIAATLIKG